MKKTAIVLNWLMLGLFGVSFLGLGIQYPSAVGGSSVLILAPYAAALLAFFSAPNRVLIGGGVFLNAVMFLFCLAYVGFGLFVGQLAIAFVVALVLLPPPVLNCLVLKRAWDRAHKPTEDANKRLQATRETRAPEA